MVLLFPASPRLTRSRHLKPNLCHALAERIGLKEQKQDLASKSLVSMAPLPMTLITFILLTSTHDWKDRESFCTKTNRALVSSASGEYNKPWTIRTTCCELNLDEQHLWKLKSLLEANVMAITQSRSNSIRKSTKSSRVNTEKCNEWFVVQASSSSLTNTWSLDVLYSNSEKQQKGLLRKSSSPCKGMFCP